MSALPLQLHIGPLACWAAGWHEQSVLFAYAPRPELLRDPLSLAMECYAAASGVHFTAYAFSSQTFMPEQNDMPPYLLFASAFDRLLKARGYCAARSKDGYVLYRRQEGQYLGLPALAGAPGGMWIGLIHALAAQVDVPHADIWLALNLEQYLPGR